MRCRKTSSGGNVLSEHFAHFPAGGLSQLFASCPTVCMGPRDPGGNRTGKHKTFAQMKTRRLLPCFPHEVEAHHLPSILPKVFSQCHREPGSLCLQHFLVLWRQLLNPCLGLVQGLLSSLEMVLIICAQEPIMAGTTLTSSQLRVACAMEAAFLQLRLPNGPARFWMITARVGWWG